MLVCTKPLIHNFMLRNSFGIIVVLIIVAGGWYLLRTPSPAPEEAVGEDITATLPAENITVRYTDDGFSPKDITVDIGRSVTWVNESSKEMWIASAMHPTHSVYGGTTLSEHCAADATGSFDACRGLKAGESYTFTFDKAGEWKYHDHIDASKFGSVTVVENAQAL